MTLRLPDRNIYIRNLSSRVTDEQVRRMVDACNRQVMEHLAPVWALAPSGVRFAPTQQALASAAWVVNLADDIDDPQALGYHTIDAKGVVSGVIGISVCLDNGAQVLTGPYSVSSVLSHEVLELVVDPFCQTWCDTGRGWMVCAEVCDPVQAYGYTIDGVQVSDFVTPAWFNADATHLSLDYLGKARRPFGLTKGGYYVRANTSTASQVLGALGRRGSVTRPQLVFGDDVPQWVRQARLREFTRVGQRLHHRPGKTVKESL
jgi:hypothetical protein